MEIELVFRVLSRMERNEPCQGNDSGCEILLYTSRSGVICEVTCLGGTAAWSSLLTCYDLGRNFY